MSEYIIPQEMNQSDRIGSFTFPQAGVMGAGILLILFMFAMTPMFLALISAPFIAFATVYLMYKKKYNIPIYEFFFVYITYRSTPKLYVYRTNNLKDEYDDLEQINFIVDDEEEENQEVT
ncbi:hypothetical protein CN918_27560 [Priestia megaterium]|nr:hypothetical protein CN918_27560 [Priestia megaterium]